MDKNRVEDFCKIIFQCVPLFEINVSVHIMSAVKPSFYPSQLKGLALSHIKN